MAYATVRPRRQANLLLLPLAKPQTKRQQKKSEQEERATPQRFPDSKRSLNYTRDEKKRLHTKKKRQDLTIDIDYTTFRPIYEAQVLGYHIKSHDQENRRSQMRIVVLFPTNEGSNGFVSRPTAGQPRQRAACPPAQKAPFFLVSLWAPAARHLLPQQRPPKPSKSQHTSRAQKPQPRRPALVLLSPPACTPCREFWARYKIFAHLRGSPFGLVLLKSSARSALLICTLAALSPLASAAAPPSPPAEPFAAAAPSPDSFKPPPLSPPAPPAPSSSSPPPRTSRLRITLTVSRASLSSARGSRGRFSPLPPDIALPLPAAPPPPPPPPPLPLAVGRSTRPMGSSPSAAPVASADSGAEDASFVAFCGGGQRFSREVREGRV